MWGVNILSPCMSENIFILVWYLIDRLLFFWKWWREDTKDVSYCHADFHLIFGQLKISSLCPPPLVSLSLEHLWFSLSREYISSFLRVSWLVGGDAHCPSFSYMAWGRQLALCQYINFQYFLHPKPCTPIPPCFIWCLRVPTLSGVHSSCHLGVFLCWHYLVDSQPPLKQKLFLHLLSVF